MTEPSLKRWPQSGFEEFFEYNSNFFHLNVNVGSMVECKRYHDEWLNRYSYAVQSWTEYDVAIWSVRCRQSLKLSFSATYFAISSGDARRSKVLASAYYLAYYSMLHAMWAVIFLHPDQPLHSITEIGHSKLANVFHSSFTQGKIKIIGYDTKTLVDNLRFLREYYSYRMPLNSLFSGDKELSRAHAYLGGFVKQSIQLANLHSHLLRKAAERRGFASASIPFHQHEDFKRDFCRINAKEHPARNTPLLDPADEYAQYEYLKIGCDLMPLSLEYDHMFDDYMTYMDDMRPEQQTIATIRRLVGNVLF